MCGEQRPTRGLFKGEKGAFQPIAPAVEIGKYEKKVFVRILFSVVVRYTGKKARISNSSLVF